MCTLAWRSLALGGLKTLALHEAYGRPSNVLHSENMTMFQRKKLSFEFRHSCDSVATGKCKHFNRIEIEACPNAVGFHNFHRKRLPWVQCSAPAHILMYPHIYFHVSAHTLMYPFLHAILEYHETRYNSLNIWLWGMHPCKQIHICTHARCAYKNMLATSNIICSPYGQAIQYRRITQRTRGPSWLRYQGPKTIFVHGVSTP